MVVSGKWELGWEKAILGFALLRALCHLAFKIKFCKQIILQLKNKF